MLTVRESLGPPVNDLRRAVRACKFRDYNLEGIEMFLALEDLSAPRVSPASGPLESGRLGRLAEDYLGRLAGRRSRVSLDDVATALEVLAAHHFDPVRGEDPRTNMATLGGLTAGPLVRAVNFHNTPRARAAEIERWLLEAGKLFRAVGEKDLEDLFSGTPHSGSPGQLTEPPLIPVFYEGYRNNYDVALPMVERAGLRAWFFIPSAFIDTPVSEQYAFARSHYIGLSDEDYPGKRCAMSWDELRDVVARGHVVACHTATHCAVFDLRGPEDVRRELFDSRRRLEDELGCEVRTLAWLLGTSYGEDRRADDAVQEAGYRLVVSNAKIQRLPGSDPEMTDPSPH